jgi:NADH dehydrogenase
MKVAITGGTGFLGRNVARELVSEGHEVVLVARGQDRTAPEIWQLARTRFVAAGLDSKAELVKTFAGCRFVMHCAGVNRERGEQTYKRVHIEGTRHVVEAARESGIKKIILISFLRARPDCGSGYHESKWAAEQIVRESGLDFTVLKCGVIYGKGDHMLNHLSHAFHTFHWFALVGFKDKRIRPIAVEDVARIVKTIVVRGALSRKTVPVLGPEELTLREAVVRVSGVVGRKPVMFPMPVWFHYALAWFLEKIMVVPMVSLAQVRILSEGLCEPWLPCEPTAPELAPRIGFSEEQIRKGLPPPGPFCWRDLRCCNKPAGSIRRPRSKRVFFEMP